MTKNKLVELPSDTSNLQSTYHRHTIGQHKSHKSVQEEWRWGGIPPLIGLFTT